jgi:glycosyltransferase involved in cell wall biosynthesis
LRIAVLTRTVAHVGGIETYAALSMAGLRSRKHDVHALVEDEEVPSTGAGGGRVLARDLLARVRALNPDVLLSHGLSDPTVEARLVNEWPTTFFAHVYHGTCVGGAKTFSFPSPQPCARALGAGCLLRYYPRRCGGLSPVTMLRQFVVQRRRLELVKACRAVVALSRHIIDEYARNGVDRARLTQLPPLLRAAPASLGQPPPDAIHVAYIGRFERLKGPGVLLDALGPASVRLDRPVRATFAGEGLCAADLERQARRLEAAWPRVRVTFTGKLTPDGVDALLARTTLLVVPSLWPEPFGLVGLEAASHGVPAVAFAVGGIPDWLREGIGGHFAGEPGSARSLADAIVAAVHDPAHYDALRRGARLAAEGAAAERHMERLEHALQSAAATR